MSLTRGVPHQFLDRTQAKDLVHDFANELTLFGRRQGNLVLAQEVFHTAEALLSQLFRVELLRLHEIQRLYQPRVDERLELLAQGRISGPARILSLGRVDFGHEDLLSVIEPAGS